VIPPDAVAEFGTARGVSFAGERAFGDLAINSEEGFIGYEWIWDRHGTRTLVQEFLTLGLEDEIDGLSFDTPEPSFSRNFGTKGISYSGRNLAGTAYDGSGRTVIWRARIGAPIPEPSACLAFAALLLVVRWRAGVHWRGEGLARLGARWVANSGTAGARTTGHGALGVGSE